jgi:hypothetical protein
LIDRYGGSGLTGYLHAFRSEIGEGARVDVSYRERAESSS